MENFHGFNKNKSVEIDKLQEAIQFLEFEKSRLEGQFKQTCEINTELKKWYTQSVETKSAKTSLRNELLSKIDFYESSAERLDESIKKSERSLNFLKKNFDEMYASFKSTCEKYERKLNEKVEITQKGKISLANAFKSFQLTKSASHVLSITYEAAMIEERIENLEKIKDNLCESIAKKKFNDHMKWWTEIKSDIIEMAKIMRALNEKEKEREKAKEKQESEQANFQSPKLNSEVVEIEVDKPEDNLNISRSSIVITPKSLNNKDVLISPENQKSENSKFSFDFGNFMASKKPGSNTSAESTFDFDAFISRRNESKFKMNNDLMKMFETPTKSSMKFDSSVESTSKPTNKSDTTTFNLF